MTYFAKACMYSLNIIELNAYMVTFIVYFLFLHGIRHVNIGLWKNLAFNIR
jgi:hypothetical protein